MSLVLTLATVTLLAGQSVSSYRITHTYTLGWDGERYGHGFATSGNDQCVIMCDRKTFQQPKLPTSFSSTPPRTVSSH